MSGCNEVVSFTNLKTSEKSFKIYDKEAKYGWVTCLKVSGDMLAIGYSSGTIIVFDLDLNHASPDDDNKNHL
mgnify:CR=1 FL=1